MENTQSESGMQWHRLPLCRKYQLVRFAAHPLLVGLANEGRTPRAMWALGALSEGPPAVLGVWAHSAEGALNWSAVFDELATRGVERIRYIIYADAAAAQAAYPQVTVLGNTAPLLKGGAAPPKRLLRSSLSLREVEHLAGHTPCELPRRISQLARRCDEVARRLQWDLGAAALRHGPFESGAAAAAFVEAGLMKAEDRHRRRRLAQQWKADLRAAAAA
jgi:hypothetical protein